MQVAALQCVYHQMTAAGTQKQGGGASGRKGAAKAQRPETEGRMTIRSSSGESRSGGGSGRGHAIDSDVVPGGCRLLLPGVAPRYTGNETIDASEAHEDDRGQPVDHRVGEGRPPARRVEF